MNLELTARDVADLQKAVAEMRADTAASQKATADRFALWELERKHLDEKVNSLADSTRMLLNRGSGPPDPDHTAGAPRFLALPFTDTADTFAGSPEIR